MAAGPPCIITPGRNPFLTQATQPVEKEEGTCIPHWKKHQLGFLHHVGYSVSKCDTSKSLSQAPKRVRGDLHPGPHPLTTAAVDENLGWVDDGGEEGRRRWEWGDIASPSKSEVTWQTSQRWKERDMGSHRSLPLWTLWKFILAFWYFFKRTINSNSIHGEDVPTQKSFGEPKARQHWDALLCFCACEGCSFLQVPWEAWNRPPRFQDGASLWSPGSHGGLSFYASGLFVASARNSLFVSPEPVLLLR